MTKPRTIRLDKIRVDSGLQARCQIDDATVEAYAQALRDQEDLPAVVVYDDGSGEYWLADGFHRDRAHRAAGMETIKAVVTKGSRRDALLYAIGANSQHGLRRTNADKRKAVMMLLDDPEWGKWSDRKLAKLAAVSNVFVSKLREEKAPKQANKTPLSPVNGLQETKESEKGKPGNSSTQQTAPGSVSPPAVADEKDSKCDSTPKQDSLSSKTEGPAVKEFDAVGAPVPDHIVNVFRTRAKFSELAAKLSAIQKEVADLVASPAGAVYATQLVRKSAGKDSTGKEKYRHSCEHLNNARNRLLWAEPHSRCPYCHHAGKVTQGCKACHGLGWVIETVFSAAPADYVAAVMKLAMDVPPEEAQP